IKDIKIKNKLNRHTNNKTVNTKFRYTNNVIHSMTFDIPKIYDGKYMKINGGKKILTKQLFMNPIVKYKPDEVWVTTNYNKFIIEKFGDKTSNELEWIKTLFDKLEIDEFIKSGKTLKVKKGNASLINIEYLTSVEYNNLSTFLLRISDDKYTILFNQRTLGKEL